MRLDLDFTQGKIKKKLFFTSDFHMWHHNILNIDDRPFIDIHEMHEVIEANWNEVVGPNDIVIYLGDLSFAKREDKAFVESMVNRLNGEIHYVMGNHDKWEDIKHLTKFKSQQDYLEVRLTEMVDDKRVKTLFCCMHYPIYSWNQKHRGGYHCHGHSHMGLSEDTFHKKNRIIDVGCMGYDYTPISHHQVIEKLAHIELENLTNKDKQN